MSSRSPYTPEIADYFSSTEWQKKRAERLRIDNWHCRFCNAAPDPLNPLQVHHLPGSYARIPHESVEHDLITLCSACHKALHKDLDKRRKQWEKQRRQWRTKDIRKPKSR